MIKRVVGTIFIVAGAASSALAISAPQLQSAVQSAQLVFEPNQGQAVRTARFLTRFGDYKVEFMAGKVVFSGQTPFTMELIGGRRAPVIAGVDPLPSKTHYLTDSDPRKWKRNIPNFGKVRYRDVYPGIDMVFYGNQRNLEYDLVLSPGADPNAIRVRFIGGLVELEPAGDILVRAASGEFRQRKPVVYQEIAGERKPVSGSYSLVNGDVVFRTAPYDRARALVIDPVLSYVAALVNANSAGFLLTPITVDGSGFVYTVAWPNLILKMSISSSGAASVLWSTYFGGGATGIATDGSGNVYITGGSSGGSQVPIVNGFQPSCSILPSEGGSCVYLAKLSSDGSSVLYSSYTGKNPGEWRPSIATDSNGNAFLAASTPYNDFPTKNAYQPVIRGNSDIVITKVDTTQSGYASLIYSTFFGGSLADVPTAVAADSAGNVYVTGATQSSDFPTMNPLQRTYGGPPGPPDQGGDAFVVKLDPAGTLVYSTYLGGSDNDKGNGIAVDASGNIYLSGSTTSSDFPVHNGLQLTFGGGNNGQQYEQIRPGGDAFVAKISPDGSTLLYSSYLGGSGDDTATGIAIDPIGGLYVAGTTFSADFPQANPLHGVGVLKSTDGGASWSIPGVLPYSAWSVIFDPKVSTKMYAATAKGVFVSADKGSTWTGTTVTAATQALAFDSSMSPSIVYAATENGVFKSSDGGITWVAINNGLGSTHAVSILVVPGHTPTLWAATFDGLYKSTDRGNTWTLSFSNIAINNANGVALAPLAFDPNSGTIYVPRTGGTNWGTTLSASSDGGITWRDLPIDVSDINAIAVSSSSVIYVDDDYFNGLIKSSDGGITWVGCNVGGDLHAIAFDPTTPATVYRVGIFSGLASSRDGCATWTTVLTSTTPKDIAFDPDLPSNWYVANYLGPRFPPTAFVAKIDPAQIGPSSLIYSSHYGALGDVFGNGTTGDGIAVDPAGNAFVVGSISTDVTNADGTFTPRTSPWIVDTLLLKVGGLVVTSPSNPTAQSGGVTTTFSTVNTSGSTTMTSIDPATAGQAPGQFAISNLAAYDISTTASVSGPIVSCFVVSSVSDASTFANLRVLHSELTGSVYQLVDRTILSGGNAPNFSTKTLCAQTSSLSPFYFSRTGQSLVPVFDQTKAYKKGSTLPVKVRLGSSTGANLSSATIPLTIRNIRLLGSATLASTADSGNSNPDVTFRYDASLGGYIYNLSLKSYAPGRYGLSVFAGSDRNFFYTVEFQVQ